MPEARRPLHFNSLDDAAKDADALAAVDRAGKLRQLGNWTLGQTYGHIAAWIDFAFDGIPLKIPWFIRPIVRPMKNRVINQPMKPAEKWIARPHSCDA